MIEDADIADFRRAVRGHLAERPAVAQCAATVHRHLAREYQCTLADVENALAVLTTFHHLKVRKDPMGGGTLFYQADVEGILAHERGE